MKKEQGKKVNWGDMGIILTLIAMIIFFSVVTKSFLSAKNFANIARQISRSARITTTS